MDTELTATAMNVSGMDCAGCARKINEALRGIDGVRDVSLHYPDTVLGVLHDDRVSDTDIQVAVQRLGFSVSPAEGV